MKETNQEDVTKQISDITLRNKLIGYFRRGFGFAFEELIKEDPSENCNFYLDGEAQNLKKLAISVAH
ncbi:hypothetical protein NC652_020119, partial [Populus alba x Populus x berolinensis]